MPVERCALVLDHWHLLLSSCHLPALWLFSHADHVGGLRSTVRCTISLIHHILGGGGIPGCSHHSCGHLCVRMSVCAHVCVCACLCVRAYLRVCKTVLNCVFMGACVYDAHVFQSKFRLRGSTFPKHLTSHQRTISSTCSGPRWQTLH